MGPGVFVRHLGASGTLAWLDLRRQHAGVLLTQVKWGAARLRISPAERSALARMVRKAEGD